MKRVKRDFIEGLWVKSQQMREEEWKSMARRKLWEFEDQLSAAFDAGINSYSGQRSWSFLNSVVYSLSIVTTIGTNWRHLHHCLALEFNYMRIFQG